MSENQIAIYEPGRPLGHPKNLHLIRGDTPEAKMQLATMTRAWPGDLDPQRRMNKTLQLLEQAAVSIATSERPDSITNCCQVSILDSLTVCASLDLSIQKAMGECYLVPFAGICTAMIGYRGFIKLLVNTGFVSHIESVLVYEGETFEYNRDENGAHWRHLPDIRKQGHDELVVACYAAGYPTHPGASPLFELLNKEELEKVKRSSAAVRSGKKGPYDFWATEMMRKAPIRRLQKYMPKTADNLGYEILAHAVEHDNKAFDLAGYAEAQGAFQDQQRERKQLAWAKSSEAPAQTPKPATPDAPAAEPVQAATPAPPTMTAAQLIAKAQAYIDGRHVDGALPAKELLAEVRDYVVGPGVKHLTQEQFAAILAEATSGKWDLATAKRIPDDIGQDNDVIDVEVPQGTIGM
jgi:phage RecT family recombinase